MGLGFANRNLRKDVHVRSEVDANWTILMLNASSLMNKIDELITIVQTYIVAITETWLHDQINDAEVAINDYHIFRKDREGRGGEALLLIKSSLPKSQIQLKHDGSPLTDLASSTITTNNPTLNVLCVYRSPCANTIQN